MRIGVNTLFLIPGAVGGSETYLRRVLPPLAEAAGEDRLVLFTNTNNDAVLRADLAGCGGVEFVALRLDARNRYARIAREQIELPRRARRAGIDVLWSPGYTTPLLTPCPRVTSILDVQYKTHPEDLAPLALLSTGILVPLAAWRSRRLIAISDFARGEIVDRLGAPAEKVAVTLLGVDPAFAAPPDAQGRPIRSVSGTERPYLLAVSNTYPHKNLHAAVEAFGLLADTIPHDRVIVGQPRRGEPALRRAVARLREPGRVIRRQSVAGPDLVRAYQGAAVFLFPSLYEGFGLPVLEAMMAGVPVVAARRASLPELGGDTVTYADPPDAAVLAEAVRGVLGWSPDRRAARCAAARARAETFAWARTARETLAVLRDAAGVKR
jgi:glycosyltransferase involved in cell wall biosynthesis